MTRVRKERLERYYLVVVRIDTNLIWTFLVVSVQREFHGTGEHCCAISVVDVEDEVLHAARSASSISRWTWL